MARKTIIAYKKVQVAGLDNAMQLALFIKRDCYLRI